jgi:hypothetical protein
LYQIAFWALAALALSRQGLAAEDPDVLYAQRATLAKAAQAAAIWQAALDRNPSDFDAAWKRARAGYWIGGHETTQPARDAAYEAAMAAARKAIAAHPDKPEGHFWLAANMGGYAQDHGIRGGLNTAATSATSSRRSSRSTRRFSRDRPIARWAVGTSRCPGSSAAASASPKNICGPLSPTIPAASSPGCSSPRRSRHWIGATTPSRSCGRSRSRARSRVDPGDTEFKTQARAMLARLTQGK